MLELTAGLPPGELSRCFLPRWGLRVHGSEQLFALAFCFRCNQVRLWGRPEGVAWQAFDAQSEGVAELLRRFEGA